MNKSKELEMALFNDADKIKKVEVLYSNGEAIDGFVKTVTPSPYDVIICKSEIERGQNPYHRLNFERAIEIKLIYHSGEIQKFN